MLRLGLDLGTNSIGWALYRLDGSEPPEPEALIDGGVLIYPDGRNSQNRASNAAERRAKRGPRRNRDRMLRRRRRVANLLRGCDLLPDSVAARTAARNLDPLRLRAEALDRTLAPYDLGRVLLSFADRRGFKSNRRADGGEDSAIRKDTGELRRRMAQSGARTLGEFLWRRRTRGKTILARPGTDGGYGGLYPDRAMVEHELAAIRDAQAPHHPRITDRNWGEIIDTLLHQRPLRPVERGKCTLIPEEPRAYKAYPLFQRFRIWQEVLNIEVAPPGDGFRPLEHEERARVATKLMRTAKRTFEQIVADAALPEGTRVNLRSIARDRLDGDLTASALRTGKRFGKAWDDLSLDRQQDVVERLTDDEDHEGLVGWLQEELGLDEEAAEAVATARLPQGTGSLSKAAVTRMLPHMQAGKRYHEAVEAAGLGHHSDMRGAGDSDRLPYYGETLWRQVVGGRADGRTDAERYGRVANPTVHIALGQVRRLFNAVADRYGKPDEVVVELARELKQNYEQRIAYQRGQRENRERNDRLHELAARAGYPDPSPQDMRKLRLWEEQGPVNGRVCPFTGEPLSVQRVLSEETEIEHLLPYSRSLDNSMNNTAVVMRAANREKGDRTPFEAWGHDPNCYDDILARARLLPQGKQWRFREDAMERWEGSRDFLDRQLNENSYLSRIVREYLEAAVDPKRIWVTPGRMTSMLRREWGLNSILSGPGNDWKNRDDHRHHLIDAAVIGMTSRSLLQRVAHASGHGQNGASVIGSAEPPWEGFRADVKQLIERCVVRHRPDHFTATRDKQERRGVGRDITSGGLHNETAYGIVDGPDDSGMMTLVETKTLTSLDAVRFQGLIDPDKADGIRDHALRDRLRALWNLVDAEGGGNAEKWGRFVERAWRDHGVRRVRVLVRQSEDSLAFIRDESGRVYKAYKTDSNAYMDIWQLPNGKTAGETASLFDAHQPGGFRSEVTKDYPTAKKLMRLHRDDMIAIGEGDERRILRVKEISGQKIVAVDNRQGGKAKEMTLINKRATRVLKEGLRKVSVDVLGRVQDGGPFGPDGRGRNGRS